MALAWGGYETVHSFARMERQSFLYVGPGIGDSSIGIGYYEYVGAVFGLRSDLPLQTHYKGASETLSVGVGTDLGVTPPVGISEGVTGFRSYEDPMLRGNAVYFGVSGGVDLLPLLELSHGLYIQYFPLGALFHDDYVKSDGSVDRAELVFDIMRGANSPLQVLPQEAIFATRLAASIEALRYADIYEELQEFQSKGGFQ